LHKLKKPDCLFDRGNPAILKDPWLSVPGFRPAWLFLLWCNYIISKKKKSNAREIALGNIKLTNLGEAENS